MNKNETNLSLKIEKIESDSEEFTSFLKAWSDDIESYFPDFSIYDITFAAIYLVKVNNESAGLFIYQDKGEELHIEVDYIIPKLRNKGIGKEFFNEKLDTFRKEGFEIIISVSDNDVHQKYLKSLGFKQSKKHHSRFELNIK